VAFFIGYMQRIRIVGGGLSASILVVQALSEGYAVDWWKSGEPTSSLVAAGIINPMVLKRLRLILRSEEYMTTAEEFYSDLNLSFKQNLHKRIKLFHILQSDGEINDWHVKAESTLGNKYLGSICRHALLDKTLGELKSVSWLDSPAFLTAVEGISSEDLTISNRLWQKIDLKDKVETILCQGWKKDWKAFGIDESGFNPAKGEVLIIKSNAFPLEDGILHGGVFVLPLGNGLYKIGSTYSWNELDDLPSKEGLEFLVSELDKMWKGSYTVIRHMAAVRPTTIDRRPLVGRVTGHSNLSVLNGMGSRAVLMAPLLSLELLNNIFKASPLAHDISPSRFSAKLGSY